MPRKRQIDPDIWTSEQVIALSIEARLMFIGMISHGDDEGRLKGSPLSLKVSIFPADAYSLEQVKQWRDEVVANGLAIHYENGGFEYLWLPTFHKYQYMTKTFPSKLPPPPSEVNNKLITNTKPVSNELHGIGIGIGIDDEIEVSTTKKQPISKIELFWQAYPKKKSKGQAEKAFERINPDDQLLATILAAIERAKESEDWQKDRGKYIQFPATWLNAKGWQDEFPEKDKPQPTGEDGWPR